MTLTQTEPRFLTCYLQQKKVGEIAATNKMGMSLATVPYKIGLGMAVTAGLASIPLVFHLDTALWFNEHFGELPSASFFPPSPFLSSPFLSHHPLPLKSSAIDLKARDI
jgi:hypothetical protein